MDPLCSFYPPTLPQRIPSINGNLAQVSYNGAVCCRFLANIPLVADDDSSNRGILQKGCPSPSGPCLQSQFLIAGRQAIHIAWHALERHSVPPFHFPAGELGAVQTPPSAQLCGSIWEAP